MSASQPGDLTRSEFLWSVACTPLSSKIFDSEQPEQTWQAGTYNFHLEPDGTTCYDIEMEQSVRAPFRDPKSLIWDIVLPVPPTLQPQQISDVLQVGILEAPDATIVRVQDSSPVDRKVNLVRLNGDQRVGAAMTAQTRFQIKVAGRQLVSGKGRRPEPISSEVKRFFLRTSENIDHANPEFQKWLDDAGLRRGKTEGDLDFGYRSFLHVHKHFVHDQVAKVPPPNYFNVSRLCRERVMGCGHSSNLHAAILRANGVPARILCGRHARSSDRGSDVWHVRADFWCESVGWIPVNHGVAAERYNPDDFFGKISTGFITLLEDNDLDVMRYGGGRSSIGFLQSVQTFWSNGGGPESWSTSQRWKVEKIASMKAPQTLQRPNLLPRLGSSAWDSEFHLEPEGSGVHIKTKSGSGKGKPRAWCVPRDSISAIRDGRTYLLEFSAKADNARDIFVRSTSEQNDLSLIGLDEPIGLTRNWQTFGITFQAKNTRDSGNWAPIFAIPRVDGDVWLRDVKMTEFTS